MNKINKIENREIVEKFIETELVLWKDESDWQTSNNTDKRKKKKEEIISNIRNETIDITADPADIKRVQKIMLCTNLHI